MGLNVCRPATFQILNNAYCQGIECENNAMSQSPLPLCPAIVRGSVNIILL